MWRLYILVFRGEERFDDEVRHHLHESPRSMVVPLTILAVLSIVGGWVGIPEVTGFRNLLAGYLAPVLGAGGEAARAATHAPALQGVLMSVLALVAGSGLVLGWGLYRRRPE